MSPTIIVKKGERVFEVEVSDLTAKFAAEYLNRARTDFLIDPLTRQPYPSDAGVAKEVFNLGKALHSTSRPEK